MGPTAETLWQLFAATGSINRYLDYRQAAETLPPGPVEERKNGELCHHGAGSEGNPL